MLWSRLIPLMPIRTEQWMPAIDMVGAESLIDPKEWSDFSYWKAASFTLIWCDWKQMGTIPAYSLTICVLGEILNCQLSISGHIMDTIGAFSDLHIYFAVLILVILQSAWFLGIHCCLLSCPLMLSEATHCISQSHSLYCRLHEGTVEALQSKCPSATACHVRLVSLSLLAYLTNTELDTKSSWITLF